MATIQVKSSSKGSVNQAFDKVKKEKTQFYNSETGHFINKDSGGSQIFAVEKDGLKFKGVRLVKTP